MWGPYQHRIVFENDEAVIRQHDEQIGKWVSIGKVQHQWKTPASLWFEIPFDIMPDIGLKAIGALSKDSDDRIPDEDDPWSNYAWKLAECPQFEFQINSTALNSVTESENRDYIK